jgi:hypothetical protein
VARLDCHWDQQSTRFAGENGQRFNGSSCTLCPQTGTVSFCAAAPQVYACLSWWSTNERRSAPASLLRERRAGAARVLCVACARRRRYMY